MPVLFHGTTLHRAERVRDQGPDPDFIEPGDNKPAENFSACLTFGPFDCVECPETYACGKAKAAIADGRDEGGPALLIFDAPEDIVALAVNEWFPLSQGFVQFDLGAGFEELLAAWPALPKRILLLVCP